MVTGWKQSFLGDIITFQRGFDLPEKNRREGNIPIVSSAGIIGFHNRYAINYPTVITGRYGTIGKLFFINSPCWPLNTTLYINNFHGNDEKFIYYFLNRIRFTSFSDKSGVPGVNRNDLHSELVEYPTSIAEQQAIAAALSDVDALLSSLSDLIAKKRNIKKAAMQELLTGKTRLPGFQVSPALKNTEVGVIPEDWEVNCIKNLAEIKTGKKNTQDSVTGGKYPFFVRSQTVERINTYSFDGEAVLTAGDGDTGKVFHYINGKFDYHQRVYKISNFSNKLNGYFFYLYFSNYFYDRIMQMTAKSTVDSVRMEMIADMPIALPSLAEQQAIASVLSDMDAEIAALEARQEKIKHIKQGMMQNLLTGKIRLRAFCL